MLRSFLPLFTNVLEKLSEKSLLASETIREEGTMAHREPIFGHCLPANWRLGYSFTDFQTVSEEDEFSEVRSFKLRAYAPVLEA